MLRAAKVLLLALAAISLLGLSCLPQPTPTPAPPAEVPEEFHTLWEVWDTLSRHFVDKEALDPGKLSQGAIRGMLQALDDPYTSYLDEESYKLEQSSLEGKFEGIGATVGIEDGQLVVISPIPNSPAEKAGIRAGDKILVVDGQPTSGMSLNEAVLKIRGPRDTSVRLSILHQDATEPVEMAIVRAEIEVESVRSQLRGDIAYIQISHFSERTEEELASALKELLGQGAAGILLDLRNNPGGLLPVVVEVTSQFLEEGVVLYEVDSEGRQKLWPASPGGMATDLPLAVLVNRYSASGSEVLAGALQDYGRAPIIGTKTFGKGSVNMVYPLRDGSALFLTVARWLTPNGHAIEGKGLTPDVEVELTPEDVAQGKDPQLDQALDYLKQAGRGAATSQACPTLAGVL